MSATYQIDLEASTDEEKQPLMTPRTTERLEQIISEYDDGKTGCCKNTCCCPCRFITNVVRGLIGVICFVVALVALGLLLFTIVFAWMVTCCGCCNSSFVSFVRRRFGNHRLTLERSRHWNIIFKIVTAWHVRNILVGLFQIFEYMYWLGVLRTRVGQHNLYYELYGNGPYPYLFGIAITDRKECLHRITNEPVRGGFFNARSIDPRFRRFPWPHSLSDDDPLHILAERLAWMFGHSQTPYPPIDDDVLLGNVTDENALSKWQKLLFYRMFAVRLSAKENAQLGMPMFNNTFPTLFPMWFNFLLCGHYFSRRHMDDMDFIVEVLFKKKSPRLLEIAQFAEDHGCDVNVAIRAAVYIFHFAAGGLLLESIVAEMEEHPEHKTMFRTNPKGYILEFLRIYNPAPVTATLAREPYTVTVDGSSMTFPVGTSICNSLAIVDNDPDFWVDPHSFMIDRDHSQALIFNGIYEQFTESGKPPRGCPVKDLGLDTLTRVVAKYVGN